jgi:hypothetical protein
MLKYNGKPCPFGYTCVCVTANNIQSNRTIFITFGETVMV